MAKKEEKVVKEVVEKAPKKAEKAPLKQNSDILEHLAKK